MRELIDKMKRIRIKDLLGLFLLLITFIPGKIMKCFSPKIWVISEYEMMARDNGYWFYKYLREVHPELKAYYPISKQSPDYNKIKKLGNIVSHGGLCHYVLFWAATYYCSSSSVQGFPYPRICEEIVLSNLHGFKYVFLNHGITRGYSSIVNGKGTNYSLLCTCSEKDKKVIIEENNQQECVVQVTGFARHDNLNQNKNVKKTIIVMPTWRGWLSTRNIFNHNKKCEMRDSFVNSEYYLKYIELLNNEELLKLLENNDINLVFYLHQNAQEYSDLFSSNSDRVIIGKSDEYDVQTLLKEGAVLITDYSSVCYDFAYMYKPVIYYQFDIKEFSDKQYAEGKYFSYKEDGFGEVCYTIDDVVVALNDIVVKGYKMPEKYITRVNNYFAYRDTDNCKRIYEKIIKL